MKSIHFAAWLWRLGCCWLATSPVSAQPDSEIVKKLSLPTNDFIERADFFYWRPEGELKAALILCPGKNGNGESWVKEEKWRQFAQEHHLLLCGLWFVSKQNYPLPCYSNAASGSGELVLGALRQIGAEKLPLLLYGFSAGAQFTASFVENYPGRVLTWCACAVGQWIPPIEESKPPHGIVATGEYDAVCFWASLQYFQQARKLNREWTWVSAPKVAHQRSPALEEFIRDYFAWRLDSPQKENAKQKGAWRDINTRKPVEATALRDQPGFATWLPTPEISSAWEKLHEP